MGRHIWFRTPTKDDRRDIFDLYLGKVDHEPDLDTDKRRDELARITNGYSPAMIEQVCSMALTYAHSEGRRAFGWPDIVEAMTTIESGTAQGIDYIPEETRAVAIHEAGHAVASHVYMKDVLSTRLSIRMRGGSLGHHQAIEKEERFSSWRHEEVGKLVWTLGAMAAERVFYGENSTGVGGDVQSATAARPGWSAPAAWAPSASTWAASLSSTRTGAQELMERFERIGLQIMNRAGSPGLFGDNPGGRGPRPARTRSAPPPRSSARPTSPPMRSWTPTGRPGEDRRRAGGAQGDLRRRGSGELLDSVSLQRPALDLMDRPPGPKGMTPTRR